MKKMVKVTIILTIIIVLLLAIVNSCARLQSSDYQSVVSYDSGNSEIATLGDARDYYASEDLGVVGSILRYEQIILVSSIVLVIIFTIIFLNATPKKRG